MKKARKVDYDNCQLKHLLRPDDLSTVEKLMKATKHSDALLKRAYYINREEKKVGWLSPGAHVAKILDSDAHLLKRGYKYDYKEHRQDRYTDEKEGLSRRFEFVWYMVDFNEERSTYIF